jgi:dihydrofolate reductase
MRNVILAMMVSADGMTARSDGDLSWFLTDEAFEAEMLGLLRSVDAMLFGRVSYELLAGYWPTAGTQSSGEAPGGFTTKEREIEFARLMNSIPKVVFSRTLGRAEWGPATLIRGNIAGEMAAMKKQPGRDLVLFAGANLASQFMNLDLVDEYRLLVHPIVLGTGIPLFKDVAAERALRLAEARTFPSGVVVLRYERDRRG